MALTRGAKKLFEWLRKQSAGAVVSGDVLMDVSDWNRTSLETYIRKNKIAPFIQPLAGDMFKVLMDGSEITEQFFDETFTQTAPRHIALSSGDRIHGESGVYELIEPLGSGAVGHVWSAKAESSQPAFVAVKIMLPRRDLLQDSKLPNVRERFRREARNGRHLDHPNIVKYLDAGDIEQNPFLIMELAKRSVADQIRATGAIPEEEAAEIVLAVVHGLSFLHAKRCPHRDVKPANMLIFLDLTKLGDLGIVKWSDFDPAFTNGGTITRQSVQLGSWFYMAPEQQESPHNAVEASDIYALGVSWIEMLTGALPSPQSVGAGAYSIPPLRDGVASLIGRMCKYRCEDRPSLQEISAVIKDKYSLG